MSAVNLWWQGLSLRERRLLGLLAIIGLPVLLWLAALRPLQAATAAARLESAAVARDLARLQALAPAFDARPAATQPLGPAIEAALAAAGLSATSLDLAGQSQATLRLAAARGPVLLGLIASLEAQGLIIARASISRNQDASVSAELVIASPM